MRRLFTLLFAFFIGLQVVCAQTTRTIPYPIIFVHGWTGSDATWFAMAEQLRDQGLQLDLDYTQERGGDGSRIDFHLNADGDISRSTLNRTTSGPYYGDVFDYNSRINSTNDVFFVNFDKPFSDGSKSYSNESAATKQGFAVGIAVKKVLQATGADKVILFGHSMGGLAIREYLQNQSNWLMGDGQHHVAKLITTGTPHGGSNETSGNILYYLNIKNPGNERSEAVRDLRYPKQISVFDRGVYLFGGNEEDIFRLGLGYFNNDVDCSGYVGGQITGLNYKPLYLDVAYSCIIGIGGSVPTGLIGPNDDDIVEADKASIFNLGYQKISGDVFYADESKAESRANKYYKGDAVWHTKLTKQSFINIYALDEPETIGLAYQIQSNKDYRGFLTPHPSGTNPNGYNQDTDLFKIYLPSRGVAELYLSSSSGSQAVVNLYDSNNNLISSRGDGTFKVNVNSAGLYYLQISGNAGDASFAWHFNSYVYQVNFCPEPDQLAVSINTASEICDNQKATLTATSGYDNYLWYANGIQFSAGGNQISPTVSGIYSVQGIKACGITRSATNVVNLIIKPTPVSPTVSSTAITYCVGDVAQPLSATGTQLQWYAQAVGGTASNVAPTVSTTSAQTRTYYVTQTSSNSCESLRQPVTVNVTAPPGMPIILANQFVCQYSKPVSLTAQGQNLVWRGSGLTGASDAAPLPITDKVDTLRYTVTQRLGTCISQAAPVTVIVRKAPELPKVVTPVSFCVSSKANNLTATGSAIKWYSKVDHSDQPNNVFTPSTDKDGQFIYYATQTDVNGCESLTNPVNVIIKPKPTATLPNDTTLFRYDSLAVRIALTGDAPWRVLIWNGRELTTSQSPLIVYVKPTATISYTLQSVMNECGIGSTEGTMRVTVMEPLAISAPQSDDLRLNAFPTPTEGPLQVEWSIPSKQVGTLQLITLNGQLIWQRSLRGTGVQQIESVQLQNRPNGHYILHLTTQKGVLTQQIIKQ